MTGISPGDYGCSVFINCPFDRDYREIFDALIFSVMDAGLTPRCALEVADGTQNRLEKIMRIIERCRFGVHDLSRTEADPGSGLPRFNMPFELGIFLGIKRAGNSRQRSKACLILDRKPFRYQRFISDIAGHDIASHRDRPLTALTVLHDWINEFREGCDLPGAAEIARRYTQFQKQLPLICRHLKRRRSELSFNTYRKTVRIWLNQEKGI